MTLPYTGPDALSLVLAGGESAAGLYGADASLGGVPLAQEVAPLGWQVVEAMPTLVVQQVSGEAGPGLATLRALTTNSVAYTAPGGVEGTAVAIADGETRLVQGANVNHWVRVARQGTAPLTGVTTLNLVKRYGSILAHRNPTSAERSGGLTTYRAGFLRAHEDLTNLRLYVIGSGFSIGSESPGSDGAIALPASETTAPSGITWVPQGNVGGGLYVGSLAAGRCVGLRIRRVLAGAVGVGLEVQLWAGWTVGATNYHQTFFALYSAPNDALEGFVYWVGVDAAPDPSGSPTGTFTGASALYTPSLPPSGLRTYNVITGRRSRFGLISLNREAYSFTLNSSGTLQAVKPSAPTDVVVSAAPNGCLDVLARYNRPADASPADTWAVYAKAGADPVPGTDSPTLVSMAGTNGGYSGSADNPLASLAAFLRTTLGPFAWGADVHVLVRARRSGDGVESANTVASTCAVATYAPVVPAQRAGLLGAAQDWGQGSGLDVTTVLASSPAVFVRQLAGESQLWAGGSLVWRCVWPDAAQAGLYFPGYAFFNDATVDFGAGTGPVDVVGTNLYLVVAGRRRVKIDTALGQVRAALFQAPGAVTDAPVPGYAWMGAAETCFQIYDPSASRFRSFLSVNPSSVLTAPIPLHQKRG